MTLTATKNMVGIDYDEPDPLSVRGLRVVSAENIETEAYTPVSSAKELIDLLAEHKGQAMWLSSVDNFIMDLRCLLKEVKEIRG